MPIVAHPHPVPCRDCGTILQATYAEENAYLCPGCAAEVCFCCGCTEQSPCVIEVSNGDNSARGVYPCAWSSQPGTCSKCLARAAYELYQEATDRPADDPYYMNLGRTMFGVKGLAFGV